MKAEGFVHHRPEGRGGRLPGAGREWTRRYLAGFAEAARSLRDWRGGERSDWRFTFGPIAIDPYHAGFRAGLAAGWGL